MNYNDIDWNDVIKREARGINNEDFGKVQDIEGDYVLVKRGIINKKQFYLPKDQAESYDGTILKFRLSEYDLKTRYKDEPFSKDAGSESIESDINKLEEEQDSQEVEEK
jgi:hypothetical protein